MRIEELCTVAKLEIHIKYNPNAVGPWITSLADPSGGAVWYKETERDVIMGSCHGWGEDPRRSLANFCQALNDSPYNFIKIEKVELGASRILGLPEVTL